MDNLYWTRVHGNGDKEDERRENTSENHILSHSELEEEIWALFRKLEAEPDDKKRSIVRHKIWGIIENGTSY